MSGCAWRYASEKYCPATGNQPTKMTESAFRRRCLDHQENIVYCSQTCRGQNLPAGLEFIEVENYLSEVDGMGTPKRVQGACEACGGKDKSLTSHFGKKVCSMCQVVRIMAKNSPDLVKDALKEFGNMPLPEAAAKEKLAEYAEQLLWANSDLADAREKLAKIDLARQKEIEDVTPYLFRLLDQTEYPKAFNLVEEVKKLSKECTDIENVVIAGVEKISNLEEKVVELRALFAAIADEVNFDPGGGTDLAGAIAVIMADNERLREQLAEAAGREAQREVIAISNNRPPRQMPEGFVFGGAFLHAEHRDSAVLDLALDCLRGTVQGLTAERLEALR